MPEHASVSVLTRVTVCAKVRVDTLLSFHNLVNLSTDETLCQSFFRKESATEDDFL